MADQEVVAADAPAVPQEGGGGGGGEGWMQKLLRYFSYYMMLQMILPIILPTFAGSPSKNSDSDDSSSSSGPASYLSELAGIKPPSTAAVSTAAASNLPQLPPRMIPHWKEYTEGKLDMYLLESDDCDALRNPKLRAAAVPVHSFAKIRHFAGDVEQEVNVTLDLEDCAVRNCTLYLHVELSNPKRYSSTVCSQFVRFSTRRKTKLKHLFGSGNETADAAAAAEEEAEEEEEDTVTTETEIKSEDDKTTAGEEKTTESSSSTAVTIMEKKKKKKKSDFVTVATIPPSIMVDIVADWTRWETKNIPPPMLPFIKPVAGKNNVNRAPSSPGFENMATTDGLTTGQQVRVGDTVTYGLAQYQAITFINNFWVLEDYRVVFNRTSARKVNLTVSTKPVTLWKFLMFTSFTHQAESQAAWGLSHGAGAMDDIKRMLLETEPWLLVTTLIVSIMHTVMEFLTFRSDIEFWRGRKNFRGLSLQTVALNCYFQLIIFLYLYDGNETSWQILIPSGLGVIMEFFKLKTTLVLEEKQLEEGEAPAPLWAFWRRYTVRSASSYDSKTRSFDQQAMRYLLYAMAPCLLGYTIYSAIYDQHKGWYSFLLRTQVRFVYWFGFAKMTPQIFINYKLKTVGQLPWKAFIYKALNTVIDDLFAFVVKMPTMHRIAVFRDDLVFGILLYQRWIYPTDDNRRDDDVGDAETTADGEAKKEEIEAGAAASSSDATPAAGAPAAAAAKDNADDAVAEEDNEKKPVESLD